MDPLHCSLKRFITTEISSKQIVYERSYPKSLPQQKRDSYFLTEMFNVKRLIRRQLLLENDADFVIRTSNMKSADSLLAPYYTPISEDRTLVFESRFESGNLCMAVKVSDNEYNLLMQNDINTQGHTQWFFFRVRNTTSRMPVKFNIMNYVSFIKFISV